MLTIQSLLQEIEERIYSNLVPIQAQLDEALERQDIAREKRKKAVEDLNSTEDIKAQNNYLEAIKEAEEEERVAIKFQEQLEAAGNEKIESIKKGITEEYTEQIIQAIKDAKDQGHNPNPIYHPIYQDFSILEVSLLYIISANFFGDKTAELLTYFGPEDIKRDPGAESELMIAIKQRNIEAINWLLENDPDLNYCKASGSAALHMSCMMKDYSTTKRLLEKGANPNVINTYGCTPLFDVIISWTGVSFISEELMIEFLHLLKNYGADFNLKNNEGHTVFEQYLGPYTPFKKIDMNYDRAALEIFKLSQDIEIDLSKGCVGKFFMSIDNLKELITQDTAIERKITALCNLQKALVRFISKQDYLIQDNINNTLNYIEKFNGSSIKIADGRVTSITIKDTTEHKSYTLDEVQGIIKGKAIAAAQLLYDSAHNIIQSIQESSDSSTILRSMVDELENPSEIVIEEQIQITSCEVSSTGNIAGDTSNYEQGNYVSTGDDTLGLTGSTTQLTLEEHS